MKKLLSLTAIVEAVTGLGLLAAPSMVVAVLLNASLTDPTGMLLGRLAGIALITLSIICGMYRNEVHAAGVVKGLLFYNMVAAALLVYAGSSGFSGLTLWAVALLHAGMAVWCIMLLQKKTNN